MRMASKVLAVWPFKIFVASNRSLSTVAGSFCRVEKSTPNSLRRDELRGHICRSFTHSNTSTTETVKVECR